MQLDSLPSELLHNIDMWNAGVVYGIKLKLVLMRLTQHHPFLRAYTYDKMKYTPFEYYMYYDHIKYV